MNLLARPFRKRNRQSAPPSADFSEQLARKFPDAHPHHRETIAAVSPATMTSPERILSLCEAIDYIQNNNIPGDIVECGVWKGGSMAAIARTLVHSGSTQRKLWLYDTFEGMSAPTDDDVDFLGRGASQLLDAAPTDQADSRESIWCRCALEQVRDTMALTTYPNQNIRYVKGKVEDTLATESPDQISLLRLDTDWYESTRCEMETLFPKLAIGGVLVIDDYGHWQGCRKAVDEYFSQNNICMFLHRVDYTGRLGIRQA